MSAENNEPLWDANDVATFFKVSRSWVYQRVETNRLPTVRVGGLLRFRPAEIRALVDGNAGATVIELRQRKLQK